MEGEQNSLKPKRMKITPTRAVELLGPYSYVRRRDQSKEVGTLDLDLGIGQGLGLERKSRRRNESQKTSG